MQRWLLLALALGLLLAPVAAAQEEDPFADANETTDEEEADPFTTYEERRNETFQAKLNGTEDADATSATPTPETAPTTSASPTPEAADAGADTPGFGLVAALGAIGVALVVLRRR